MNDLGSRRWARARDALRPKWGDADVARIAPRVLAAASEGRPRRWRSRPLAWVVAGVCMGVAAMTALRGKPDREAAPAITVATAGELALGAGSVARVLGPGTVVTLDPSCQGGTPCTAIDLHAGAARFVLSRDDRRSFRVTAGIVAIEALGTTFEVRRNGERVVVTAVNGAVRVRWPAGYAELAAGQSATFPPDVLPPDPAPAPSKMTTDVVSPSGANWRVLAHKGDYGRAYRRLEAAGRASVRDEPADLLLAADVARLSDHPDEALSPLSRIYQRFPDDSRAALAAFTAGRVLLESQRRPRDAARAFEQAERLARTRSIKEDALARQVEAWLRSGDRVRAESAARRYSQGYPNGLRARSIDELLGRRP